MRHINNVIQKITQLALMCSIMAVSVFASEQVGSIEDSIMRGLRGGIKAAELPLRVARGRAEDLYIYNGGSALPNALDLIGTNEYINDLVICNGYWIKMTFVSNRFNSSSLSGVTTIPIPEPLFGVTVYLVPIYDANDYMITTWECVTNLTMGSVYQGDSGAGIDMDGTTTTATRALLAKYTDDAILEKCIYASDTIWTNVGTAAGDCTP